MALTTAREWLEEYSEVQLPSGKRVGLRKADPFSLIMVDGRIPDLLTHIIAQAIDNPEGPSEQQVASTIHADPDTIEEMVNILNRIAFACMVFPKVSLEDLYDPDNNIIGISHISFEDKMFLLSWAMGEEGLLAKSFPEKSAGSVLPMGTIPGVSQNTEPAAKPSRTKSVGRLSSR